MIDYKSDSIYLSYVEAIKFFQQKGYAVKCAYNYFDNPRGSRKNEMLYKVYPPVKDELWLYLILGSRSRLASIELNPQYAENVDTEQFDNKILRNTKPKLKLVFSDFKRVENAFSDICSNISESENSNQKIFEILKPLNIYFPMLEFTNIDATGKVDNRAVWIFENNKERFHNVLMEVWDKRKEKRVEIVIQKALLDKNDDEYIMHDAKVSTKNRSTLSYPFVSSSDLQNYVKRKLKSCNDNESKKGDNKMGFDKNIILYGPPGTGKTYNTICYAVAICDGKTFEEISAEAKENYDKLKARYDELKKDGRVEFTTFHQSYGYEEFIEGIRPVMDESDEGKSIEYEISEGIFKEFCEKEVLFEANAFDTAYEKMLQEAYENDENAYEITKDSGKKLVLTAVNDDFRKYWSTGVCNFIKKEAIRKQWLGKITREELTGGSKSVFDMRQIVINELKSRFGLGEPNANYITQNKVFIIDEINRGNISKIFGELITLIEPSKRLGQPEEASTILPYSKKSFGVPDNVYIIGTMNTADRSIATIDTALRRRFAFKEMLPNASILKEIEISGINVANMLDSMNKKISVLFDREHTIGHAYFIGLLKQENQNIKALGKIFKNNIIPLLQEYFYEDYEKIRLVLGDNRKQDESAQFIKAINNDYQSLFGEDLDIDISYRYEINEYAFENAEAYKYI